jgi:hypothetical protein
MSKITEDVKIDLELDEYDVLDDIQPEDFVFVINSAGQLKGISFPEEMQDDEEIDPNVEEMISYIIKKGNDIMPAGTTIH